MMAVKSGHDKIVNDLIVAGADVTLIVRSVNLVQISYFFMFCCNTFISHIHKIIAGCKLFYSLYIFWTILCHHITYTYMHTYSADPFLTWIYTHAVCKLHSFFFL